MQVRNKIIIESHIIAVAVLTHTHRGSQSIQNAFFKDIAAVLTLKEDCKGNNSENGYSVQGLLAKVKDKVANG